MGFLYIAPGAARIPDKAARGAALAARAVARAAAAEALAAAVAPTLTAPSTAPTNPPSISSHLHFTLLQPWHLGLRWRGILFYILYTKFYYDCIS
jgi:hypothetical protein